MHVCAPAPGVLASLAWACAWGLRRRAWGCVGWEVLKEAWFWGGGGVVRGFGASVGAVSSGCALCLCVRGGGRCAPWLGGLRCVCRGGVCLSPAVGHACLGGAGCGALTAARPARRPPLLPADGRMAAVPSPTSAPARGGLTAAAVPRAG